MEESTAKWNTLALISRPIFYHPFGRKSITPWPSEAFDDSELERKLLPTGVKTYILRRIKCNADTAGPLCIRILWVENARRKM